MLASLLVGSLMLSVTLVVLSSIARESAPQISQILRIVLQAALFVFVMVGHAWARWLTVILFAIASVMAFSQIGPTLAARPPNLFVVLLTCLVGGWSLFLVLSLVVPSPITRYLASRRA